jgi:hypothetical protein
MRTDSTVIRVVCAVCVVRVLLSSELLQQLLCDAQVVGIEPLGEPTDQLGQALMGLRMLALPPP